MLWRGRTIMGEQKSSEVRPKFEAERRHLRLRSCAGAEGGDLARHHLFEIHQVDMHVDDPALPIEPGRHDLQIGQTLLAQVSDLAGDVPDIALMVQQGARRYDS